MSRERSVEGEAAARVLLRHEIGHLVADVAADDHRVPAHRLRHLEVEGVCLRPVEGILPGRESGNRVREREAGRSPVLGLLVVAGDPGVAVRAGVDDGLELGGALPLHPREEGGEGEGDWALFLRAGQALHSLLRRPAGSYLIVSHGGLLNQLMNAIIGIAPHVDPSGVRFRFENTAFARVTYIPFQHRWTIDALNDRGHLKSLPSE